MSERPLLNADEVRILGCLIEKQITTPDYYPLTLNALSSAASQKSNRDPVVSYAEGDIVLALDSLREQNLAEMVTTAGSRVPKYGHRIEGLGELSDAARAVLCVMMLRGPQTVGEVKGRTTRLHAFASLQEVEATIQGLCEGEEPLLIKLPRAAGRKESRYVHVLCGPPDVSEASGEVLAEPVAAAARERQQQLGHLEQRVSELETIIATMQETIDRLSDLLD